MKKKSKEGTVLIEALLGLAIMMLIVEIVMGMSVLRSMHVFDSDCQQMEEIWTNEEYLEVYTPHKETIIEELMPQISLSYEEAEEDSP